MGRGGAVYLSFTALVLLSKITLADTSIWTVDIDEGPAPSPEDGPPFSAYASRNRALLPYQIIGVIGAYLGAALITGTLFFTVGRRLRRKAQSMVHVRVLEMVKPMNKSFDPSPINMAGNAKGWYKLRSQKSIASSMKSASGPQGKENSISTFDQSVLATDRERMQDNLADIYDQVFAGEPPKPFDETATDVISVETMRGNRSRLPQLQTNVLPSRLNGSPASFQSSRSSATLAPPFRETYSRTSPMSPTMEEPISAIEYPEPHSPRDMTQGATTSSIVDMYGSGGDANRSPVSRRNRKPLHHLTISSPVRRMVDDDDEARTPLSPRSFVDPGPAPERPMNSARRMQSFQTDEMELVAAEGLDEVRELPNPNPQRSAGYQAGYTFTNSGQPAPSITFTAPTGRTASSSAVNGSGALPFRQYQSQSPTAGAGAGESSWSLPDAGKSESSMKTTVLEARRERYGPLLTGMATPYSAYMPYTPVTPITPHLTSRAERRQRMREERALRGALTEEDQVVDDRQMWASGY